MKYTAILIYLITLSFGFSQTVNKRFYDIYGGETDSTNAYYYEIWQESGKQIKFLSYYIESNTLRSKDEEPDQDGIRVRTYFYIDGSLKIKGDFYYAKPKGRFQSFYPNGQSQAELYFEEDSSLDNSTFVKIVNYWDADGTSMVSNGNGFCKCNLTPFSDLEIIESGKVIDGLKMGSWEGNRSDNKMNFKEVYNAGKLVSGTQFRDNEIYEYDRVEKMASPTCGLITFYKYVSGVMRYPRKARRAGVQGRVFVEFVINRTGELQDVKIVKGISSECDEEALKAVKSAPKWNPGLQRGVPVKQRMVLPLTFKLG